MGYETIAKLKNKEEGERLDIKRTYKWVLEEMEYEDFRKLAKLRFMNYRVHIPYDFEYNYLVEKKDDSRKSREDYLKYLAYKLVQNLATEDVELM